MVAKSNSQIQIISSQRENARQYANPVGLVKNLWRHRELTYQFIRRRTVERYKGSYLGIVWSFITPLALLLVYTLGVFIRDITHLLGVAVQMLFFLTPIFYPLEAIPYPYRLILHLNPLTFVVNHFRRVILFGQLPDWGEFLIMTTAMLGVCLLGYIWFMKSKKTFADVV